MTHELNIPEVWAEVNAAHDRYERALVTNDIATLNELFWNRPETLRFGVAECLFGHDEIAGYRAGRPPTPLARDIIKSVITTYGRDYGTANITYRRHAMPERLGRQSQTWLRTDEGWRIVAAHVSFMDDPDYDKATLAKGAG